jgi:hypothetical protein
MKRLFSLVLLLLFATHATFAQKQKQITKVADPQKYAATITAEDLSRHLYIVAGAEMEGRETATEGQRKAAAYIQNHFMALGLKPANGTSFQQSFPVYKDEAGASELVVNGKALEPNNHYVPVAQWNNTATAYFSELVFVGHGIVDNGVNDYGSLNVAGKLVMLLDGAPAGFKPSVPGFRAASGMMGKVLAARSKGAAGVIVVAGGFPRKPGQAGGNQYVNLYKSEQYPNTFLVSDEVAKTLVGSDSLWSAWTVAAKNGPVAGSIVKADLKLSYTKKTTTLESSNVLAYVEGSDKSDEWLVITAHYDHLGKRGDVIYYGADDDGSGTVGVLEIAKAFAQAKAEGRGPRRNVLFMAVSGEEKGLWGSEYFSDHPTVPMDKVTADLNIDMIGRTDTERMKDDTLNYVYVVGDDKLSSDLKPISEGVNARYTKLVLDYKYNDPNDKNRIYFRSDHYNFARKGVPIIFYYDGMLQADYHKPTDTPDKINYPLLAKRAQLVFYTAWEMANREDQLKRDIPLTQ